MKEDHKIFNPPIHFVLTVLLFPVKNDQSILDNDESIQIHILLLNVVLYLFINSNFDGHYKFCDSIWYLWAVGLTDLAHTTHNPEPHLQYITQPPACCHQMNF